MLAVFIFSVDFTHLLKVIWVIICGILLYQNLYRVSNIKLLRVIKFDVENYLLAITRIKIL